MSIQDQINKNWLLLAALVAALIIILYLVGGGFWSALFGGGTGGGLLLFLQRKHQAQQTEDKIQARARQQAAKEISRHNTRLDTIRSNLDRELTRIQKKSEQASTEELRKETLEDLDV